MGFPLARPVVPDFDGFRAWPRDERNYFI